MFKPVRHVVFVLIALLGAAALWAQETAPPETGVVGPPAEPPAATPAEPSAPKPGTWLPAEGFENWRYEYDVSGFKPGEYNIMVRVTDSAGNISFGGPFNIVVDPKSDYPTASIANPLPAMRVGADLNVVGTCVDDDDLGSVEVRLDEGEWVKATGTNYWSYYLETADVADGLHTLYARGVDEFGVTGDPVSVQFHLDRTKPLHTITQPAFGTLVSGKLTMNGTVYDANGLKSVFYSIDGGDYWEPLKYSLDKKTGIASFSLNLDTRKLPDGPSVVWFKSVDGVGSEGVAVFLYFVDNTPPELAILAPRPDEAVNGSFTVTGRVLDTVGVTKLAWAYGKESGVIELVPGNPYFSMAFVAPASGKVAPVFSATDLTGNVVSVAVDRVVEPRADLARVRLTSPAAGSTVDGRVRVAGGARDDDGVTAIEWRLDGGAATQLPGDGAFSFYIPDPVSGARVLEVRALDATGAAGPWTQAPFTYVGAAPKLSLGSATDPDGERPFSSGMTLSTMEGRASVSGSVEAFNPIVSLSYSINGAAPVSLAAGKGLGQSAFTVPLPSSLPYGVLSLTITAVDAAGKESVFRAPLYAVNYTRPRVGPLLDFADAGADSGGQVLLAPGAPMAGAFIVPYAGEDIASVSLEPATPLAAVEYDGNAVRVVYKAEGTTAPTIVRVRTTRGHTFQAGPYVFKTDAQAPSLAISEPAFGAWIKGAATIKANAQDGGGMDRVEYSLNGGEWQSLSGSGASWTVSAPLTGLSGPVFLELRASDKSGNMSYASTAFMADSEAPAPVRLLPLAGDPAGGPRLFAVKPGENPWSIASIELGRAGVFTALDYAPTLFFEADPKAALALRVTDKAGNVSTIDLLQGLDRAGALSAPAALESLKTNVEARTAEGPYLEVTGADAVGAIGWATPLALGADTGLFPASTARAIRLSGASTINLSFFGVSPDAKKPEAFWGTVAQSLTQPLAIKQNKTTLAWEASIKLPAQPDGAVSLWFMLRDTQSGDLYGRIEFFSDSTAPAIQILEPSAQVPSSFTLVARASDQSGIRAMSFEYGAEKGSFELPAGSGDVARTFALAPKAGTALIVRAIDGSGNQGQASVTPALDAVADAPVARFVTPLDGSTRTADGTIFVYAQDDDGVASVSMAMGAVTTGAEGPGPLYALDPGAMTPAKYSAGLVAADVNGRPSAKASAAFSRLGEAPKIEISSISSGKDTMDPVATGSLVVVGTASALVGKLSAPNGLAAAEFSIDGGAWAKATLGAKPEADGSLSVSLPLPASLPFGRFLVRARVIDALGAQGQWLGAFYRVAPMPTEAIADKEGVYLSDSRVGEDGVIVLSPGESLELLFNGRPIESVSLTPAVAFMGASFEGSVVRVTANAEGLAPASIVRVRTVDGDTFDSAPLTFRSDAGSPAINIAAPAAGVWLKDSLILDAQAADPNGVAEAAWSLDGGATWTPFAVAATGTAPAPLKATIAVTRDDGDGELLLRATDRAGRQSVSSLPFFKDSVAPEAVVASPAFGDLVNGFIYIGLEASDAGDLAKAEFSPDGVAWEAMEFVPRGAEPAWPAAKDDAAPEYAGRWAFGSLVDLAALAKGPAAMAYRLTDKAGNAFVYNPLSPANPAFAVDIEADKPRVQIQIPVDNEVMRADFTVSGMAFDDDGIKEIQYRVDGGAWQAVDGANSFSVSFKLLETADNEHLFEAYALDLNGVKGDTIQHRFRVSREEPVGKLVSPDVSITNRGVIQLKGEASDANGIKEVWISFDNGNTYNKAVGTTSWTYSLDTRILADGVHSVYLKLIDGYDTPGFAAGLISVDNTAPYLEITGPGDGDEFTKSLALGGRVSDAIIVESLTLEITQIGAATPAMVIPVTVAQVYSRLVDVSALKPGWYNLKVTATDRADNRSYQSRNILIRAVEKADLAEFVFPAHGERISGRFTLDGRIVSAAMPEKATVFLGDQPFATVDLNKEGYFSLPVDPAAVEDGTLSFRIEAISAAGAAIVSETRSVEYTRLGPWVDIDSFFTGDFVSGRPYLSGSAGWDMDVADKEDKEAWATYQRLLKDRKPVKVEISRDNGRSFQEAKGIEKFKFRLETQEYANGELRLLIRVTFASGETATRKRIFTVDTKAPDVAIVQPGENGRFNEMIVIEGTAFDINGLSKVEVVVRTGDKASYEVPGFIQGSYLDVHVLGATRFETGLGLSFFEDNVKLQGEIGQGFEATPSWDNLFGVKTADTPASELSRFGGWVLGLKMLANVAYLPFGYWFGPDWDFFSMSFTIGASFTYFSQTYDISSILSPPDDKYMVLSAVVVQWEFAKFSFDTTFFKSIGLYLEGGLVFIPSEASGSLAESIRPSVALGVRLGLF